MSDDKYLRTFPTERGNRLIPDFEPAFPSMPAEKALTLEQAVKADYEVSDWHDPKNPTGYTGWRVLDRTNGREIIFSPNSRKITTKEYLRKEDEQPIETVMDLVSRVAVNVATAEAKYLKLEGISDEKKEEAVTATVLETAKRFAKRMIYREFAPNTPTFANAGGHLQQLAACFGMIPEDYLGTDDIGEDPEKQGNGIFDVLRYGAMIQKSGGGTGYNFSLTRPKNSGIATTGGRASGPVSWLKAYNAGTEEINQGGFRRGANMGVLEFWHPDIFEFISAKANNKIPFFNLSMGTDEQFWEKHEKDGYFYLTTPRDANNVPEEKRRLRGSQLLKKAIFEKMEDGQKEDWDPSLLIGDDGKTVIVRYTGKKVGFVDESGFVNISARSALEYAAEVANQTGCPGIVFFDRMNRDNPTPAAGKIRVVNPCGEQPLLNFEACNLGSINLYSCIEDVKTNEENRQFGVNGRYFYGKVIGEGDKRFQRRLNLEKLEELVQDGVHFLDNVIDMGKYPFKKIYSHVKANRKIGLGIMGLAETSAVLGMPYESTEMEDLAGFLSGHISRTAFEASAKLAEIRGVFPNWGGSIHDPESPYAVEGKTKPVRNGTRITIAPNGTTGQYAGVTGGGEPMIGIVWNKKLVNGVSLKYINSVFEEELKLRGLYSDGLMERIAEVGSVQGIAEIPDDMKARYKVMTEVSPEWHVRIQGALQVGLGGWGVDNAVSKTVNLPKNATANDFQNIFLWARKYGCKGSTGYRDGTIEGQPLTIGSAEDKKEGTRVKPKDLGELVRIHVPIASPAVTMADHACKYRVEKGEETFHFIFTDEMRKDPKTNKIYLFPREDFQQTSPPGDEIAVEFSVAGMDRTKILKEDDPDYPKLIEIYKSVTGNRSAGLGPGRVNSPTHGYGLVLEHACLARGLVTYDENGKLIQTVRKKDTVPLTKEEKDYILNTDNEEIEQRVVDKAVAGFLCADCGTTEYIFEQGCHEPKCKKCGWAKRGSCG